MMLGKRSRPPIRRTTSMTEFAPADVLIADAVDEAAAEKKQQQEEVVILEQIRSASAAARSDGRHKNKEQQAGATAATYWRYGTGDWLQAPQPPMRQTSLPPSGNPRRRSGDFAVAESTAFLRSCGLCKRRLGPGRDTFMYRGDTAFCSLECRQQHIAQEKDKCGLTSIKEVAAAVR